MKKIFACLFMGLAFMAWETAMGASFSVKKAAPVKKQESSGLESVASNSLLPGVIGLVSTVSALSKQQKELEAECVPTSQELQWVNNMVKEYAKTGSLMNMSGLCAVGTSWGDEVRINLPAKIEPCTAAVYNETGVIWNGYPIAEVVEYCADSSEFDTSYCPSSKKKKTSNVYAIFSAIDFSEEDYKADEINMYIKLMEKMDKCAPEKISARKREAYAAFLKNTITGAGQKTNTGAIWDAVGGLTQSGGASGIQSLMPAVTQFLDR